MKARMPVSNKTKRLIIEESDRYIKQRINEEREKMNVDITRRIFKTIAVALHEEFGFGHDRLVKVINAMTEIIKRSDTNEVFWEHIDREVIDYLKLPFDRRDYTENGKVVNDED